MPLVFLDEESSLEASMAFPLGHRTGGRQMFALRSAKERLKFSSNDPKIAEGHLLFDNAVDDF